MTSYSRIIHREVDDKGHVFYVAWHPELPGCMSHGDDPEEAKEMLDDARSLYLDALQSAGVEPPPPQVWTGGTLPPLELP
jgi:predicted RNase H-like HicB family nuclease